jgi:hypothetical protein
MALQLLEFERTLPISELAFWKTLVQKTSTNESPAVQAKN